MYVALSAVLEFGNTKIIAFALCVYIQHPFNKYSWFPFCARWKKITSWDCENFLKGNYFSWVLKGQKEFTRLRRGSFLDLETWVVLAYWEWEDKRPWACSARVVGEGRGRLKAACEGPWFPAKEFRFHLLESAYFAQGKGMSIFGFFRVVSDSCMEDHT